MMFKEIIIFLKFHESWLPPIIFFLSFFESIAFFSLFFPATIILLACSTFIKFFNFSFVIFCFIVASGAFLGDWLSWIIGNHYKKRIMNFWPFNRYPKFLDSGKIFFNKWGIFGIFIGRFFGPLRATIPLIAGMCEMSLWKFQIANFFSSIIWSIMILLPGLFGIYWFNIWL